ncbi:MAG: tryptophan 7-halogenase [Phycisphaeraceae bacterium]|nr:tryptophan 7-halogenase [Phycisphaerales bacterium]QOJ18717.1 MAG: tryptophan 7-halogenase [Phycisphaeraceae bacterium]
MTHANDHDVIVLGAGPAGSTVSALLAEMGYRVLVVEKERFPRYHIGESIIPYAWFPLNRLGLIDKLDAAPFTVRKHSVQFVGLDGTVSTPFYFFQHTDHDCARTWQVVRADFDQFLADNACEKGAEIRFETAARELIMDGSRVAGVRVRSRDGREEDLRAAIIVDATGRDHFSAARHDWRLADPHLKKIAIWSYFKGAKRDPGIDEGATTVAYVPDKGWFWYIPLPDDIVSVGIVADRDYLYRGPRDPDAIFAREIDIQPWISDHVAPGVKTEPCKVTGDYSYRSRHCARDGLVLVGDAFGFLDPVFSSGVFLALQSGWMAADAIDAALRAGDVSAGRFADYGRRFCQGIEAMRRLVYAFYDHGFSFAAVLKKHPHLRGDMTDCLIGNVSKDFEPLFAAVREFADIPGPLPHGAPLVGVGG